MPLFNLFHGRRQQTETVAPPTPQEFMQRSVHEKDEGSDYYPIVCPYCLQKFHVWELQFRTNTVNDGGLANGYPLEDDEKFAEFWENMNVPVVSQLPFVLRVDDVANVKAVQLWGSEEWLPMNNPETGKKIARQAIRQVRDKFDTPSSRRICPHCHNALPDVIGKYPNYVISMMGNTSSGKTVYLKRLLAELMDGNLLLDRKISVAPVNSSRLEIRQEARRMFEETIYNNEKLSDATPVGYMEPEILDLISNNQHTLLTLFDFPGEAIWEKNVTPFFQQLAQRNNENTDGWLFLFDSTSLSTVRSCIRLHGDEDMLSVKDPEDPYENAEPGDVLDQFIRQFAVANNIRRPVAFAFSKADMISRYAEDLQIPTELLCLNHPGATRSRSCVDLDELRKCDEQLRRILGGDHVLDSAKNYCPVHIFAAVSATGTEVKEGHLQQRAPARRVLDPLEWLLWMVGAMPGVACASQEWAKKLMNVR